MKLKVIGKTCETNLSADEARAEIDNDLLKYTGQNASVCYAESCDIDALVMDKQNAEALAKRVLKRGHLSVAEHYTVTIAFQNISKMMAVIMNSVQIYSTSERSGRYTLMTGNTERERELYCKWLTILTDLIKKDSPDIDERTLKTRAQENARYMLSVFTHSTSLVYTANIRQWNSVLALLKEYLETARGMEDSFFSRNLVDDLEDMIYEIERTVGVDLLEDTRGKAQNMFPTLSRGHAQKVVPDGNGSVDCCPKYGEVYSVCYQVSYCSLAQLQRHRAIKYFVLSDLNKKAYYIPNIILRSVYVAEWLADLDSVSDLVPQATLLTVKEVGYFEDFLRKCEERLCGRAMLESMEATKWVLCNLRDYMSPTSFTDSGRDLLMSWFNEDNSCKTKCQMLGYCKEPCGKIGVSGSPLERNI